VEEERRKRGGREEEERRERGVREEGERGKRGYKAAAMGWEGDVQRSSQQGLQG